MRQFEFIHYELARHDDFLAKLDNAVRNVLSAGVDIPLLYELARDLLRRFNAESGFTHGQTSHEEFHSRVVRRAGPEGVPRLDDHARLEGFLLPKILQDAADRDVM